jgi:hypothetical protein
MKTNNFAGRLAPPFSALLPAEGHRRGHDHQQGRTPRQFWHPETQAPAMSYLMKTSKIILLAVLGAAVTCTVSWQLSLGRRAIALVLPRSADLPRPKATAPVAGSRPGVVVATPATVVGEVKIDEAGAALASALDVFTSPQSSFAQKQEVLEHLRKGGRLEEAIATLKQLAAQNPNDPGIPTALGEAQISQIRSLYEGGATPASNDVAILGLQADQNFTAALALDPKNWEAQFYKAASMAHWPPMLNKGPEVIERLAALVTQQEAATASPPEYAQTYALLGEQYKAAGQPDKAAQTWQQGLGRFPLSSTLQRELAPTATP